MSARRRRAGGLCEITDSAAKSVSSGGPSLKHVVEKTQISPSNKNIPTDQPKKDQKKKKLKRNDKKEKRKRKSLWFKLKSKPSSCSLLAFSPQTRHQLSPHPAGLWSHSIALPFLPLILFFSSSSRESEMTAVDSRTDPYRMRAACGPVPFVSPLL